MKTLIAVALCLLVGPSPSQAGVTANADSSSQTQLRYKHDISVDGPFLIFGCAIVGYEYRIVARLSLEAHYGFGSMLFTDVQYYHELGVRYYFQKDPNDGFFAIGFYNGIRLKTPQKTGSASNYFLGLGNRWIFFNKLTVDVFGGMYLSGDEKTVFKKTDGYSTTSVEIGGPVRMSGTARVGIIF